MRIKCTLESKGKSDISGENCNLKRYMHPSVHSSTIHNSQVMDAATDRRMDEEDVVYIHNGVSLIHKKNEISYHLLQHGWTWVLSEV